MFSKWIFDHFGINFSILFMAFKNCSKIGSKQPDLYKYTRRQHGNIDFKVSAPAYTKMPI